MTSVHLRYFVLRGAGRGVLRWRAPQLLLRISSSCLAFFSQVYSTTHAKIHQDGAQSSPKNQPGFRKLHILGANSTSPQFHDGATRIGSLLGPRSGPGGATASKLGFNPLRSSPVICAADAALDMFFFIVEQKPRRAPSSTNAAPNTPTTTDHQPVGGGRNPNAFSDSGLDTTHHSEPSTATTISSRPSLKITGFLLGVLPQTIKIFSMRGIVGTQICAATFLVASVARAISYKPESHFTSSIDYIPFLTLYMQFVLCLWLYVHMAPDIFKVVAATATGNRSVEILVVLGVCTGLLVFILSAILMTAFKPVWRRYLPDWTRLWPTCGVLTTLQHLLPGESVLQVPLFVANTNQAFSLIGLSFIGCLQVSALCLTGGRVLSRVAARRAARLGQHSNGSLPTTSTNAHSQGSISSSRFTNTFSQPRLWLKAIFLGLCKAVAKCRDWPEIWHKPVSLDTSTEQFVLACGIFNLLTATLTYLVVFDPNGTSSPSWTSVLG